MSNPITECHQAVVQKLKNHGLNAFGHFPEKPDPPCLIVAPDEPLLTYGLPGERPSREVQANFSILLITGKADNETSVPAMFDLIFATLDAIDHRSADVSAFYRTTIPSKGEHLSCSIAIPQSIRLF